MNKRESLGKLTDPEAIPWHSTLLWTRYFHAQPQFLFRAWRPRVACSTVAFLAQGPRCGTRHLWEILQENEDQASAGHAMDKPMRELDGSAQL